MERWPFSTRQRRRYTIVVARRKIGDADALEQVTRAGRVEATGSRPTIGCREPVDKTAERRVARAVGGRRQPAMRVVERPCSTWASAYRSEVPTCRMIASAGTLTSGSAIAFTMSLRT